MVYGCENEDSILERMAKNKGYAKGSVDRTTVNLTPVAQLIKDNYAPVFGLQRILSAGLVLFARLNDTERVRTVAEAEDHSLFEYTDDRDLLRMVRELLSKYGKGGEGGQDSQSEGKARPTGSGK